MRTKILALLASLLVLPTLLWTPVHARRDQTEPPPPHHVVAPLALDVNATATVAQSGAWSDPKTWGDKPPSEWARIVVPQGKELTLDTTAASVQWMRVDGRFKTDPTKNTLLPIDSLFVNMGGSMEIPCTPQGVTATILFRAHNNAPIDVTYDPTHLSRGLVAEGPVTMCGQEKTAWRVVAKPPTAGSNVVEVTEAPLNWAVGDRVLLVGPRYGTDVTRQIANLNGRVITFDQPVKIDYTANIPSGRSIHLGNLTRNVKLESEVKNDSRLRGHVMLMGGGHSIKYVTFDHTGRTSLDAPTDPVVRDVPVSVDGITTITKVRDPQLFPLCTSADNRDPETDEQRENPRGRYPLHIHRATPFAAKSVLQGNVVLGPRNAPQQHKLRWGIANHSSDVDILDNIVHQIDGIGIQAAEEGNEIGLVKGNLVVYSDGHDVILLGQPADPLCMIRNYLSVHQYRRMAFGHTGCGIWTQGGGPQIVGNVIQGMMQGICIVTSDLGNAPRADKTNYKVVFPLKLFWGNSLSDPAFHYTTWAKGATGGQVEQVPVTDTPTFIVDNLIYGGRKGQVAEHGAILYQTHQNRSSETFPKIPDSQHHGTQCFNVPVMMVSTYTSQLNIRRVKCEAGVYAQQRRTWALRIAAQGHGQHSVADSSFDGFLDPVLRLSSPKYRASCGPNVTTDGKNARAVINGVSVACTTTAPATQKVKVQPKG